MEIKYVCSLGSLCHSAQILKTSNLKTTSYPFDWIYTSPYTIIDCIKDDFKKFLDKNCYISRGPNVAGHSVYNSLNMFAHHNPSTNEDEYNYYVRCVDRFKELLKCEGHKLFTMIFVNGEHGYHSDNFKQRIIEMNNELSKYTTNYTILCITHFQDTQRNHIFTYNDNIHFLEFHTLSESTGVEFSNNDDNNYLNNIIKSTYNFNIA